MDGLEVSAVGVWGLVYRAQVASLQLCKLAVVQAPSARVFDSAAVKCIKPLTEGAARKQAVLADNHEKNLLNLTG